MATSSLESNRWSAAMPQPNDLSGSLVTLDQNSTIIAVVIGGRRPLSEPSRLRTVGPLQAPIRRKDLGLTPRRAARFLPLASHKACPRAPQFGPPSYVWQRRCRYGSDERPCMRQQFPAASCRLPEQGSDHRDWARCDFWQPISPRWRVGAGLIVLEPPLSSRWSMCYLPPFFSIAFLCYSARARVRSLRAR